jgi:hypothetical protein
MGSPIDPADLRKQLGTYGPLATVVTVSAEQTPHVGTSLVEVDSGLLVVRVGPRAAANLELNTALCLTWPPPQGDHYQLIVDASAVEVRPDGDTYTVVATPHAGIRHRVADAPAGPSCIQLDADP